MLKCSWVADVKSTILTLPVVWIMGRFRQKKKKGFFSFFLAQCQTEQFWGKKNTCCQMGRMSTPCLWKLCARSGLGGFPPGSGLAPLELQKPTAFGAPPPSAVPGLIIIMTIRHGAQCLCGMPRVKWTASLWAGLIPIIWLKHRVRVRNVTLRYKCRLDRI